MNILFVTYDIPYPLTSGGKIRAYHMLKQLAKKHEVSLASFYRTDEHLEALKELPFIKHIYTFKRRDLYSPGTLAYLGRYPFPVALYYDSDIVHKMKRIIADSSFDAVHMESFYTSFFLDIMKDIPTVLGTENIEWKIYEEYLRQQWIVMKPLLRYETQRIKSYEEKTWETAAFRIAVSDDNAATIKQTTGKDCEVIPNGVDLDMYPYKKGVLKHDTVRFLFIGSMRYIQNRDAVSWLLSAIWPKLQKIALERGRMPLLSIVGPDTHTIVNHDPRVVIHGEVDNIHQVYSETDVLLAPLRAGSGTKFKVLEALASGIPTMTTTIGVEGIEGISHKNEIIIANEPHEFEDGLSFLLSNPSKVAIMTRKARDVIEKTYSWDAIGENLLSFYETVVSRHRQLQ